MNVSIHANIVYTGFLDDEIHERAPFFDLWSSIASHQQRIPTSFPIEWEDQKTKLKGKPTHVMFEVSELAKGVDKAAGKLFIRPDDTLAVRAKIHSRGNDGSTSFQNAGECIIPIGIELTNALKKENWDVKKANEHIKKLVVDGKLVFCEYEDSGGGLVEKGSIVLSGLKVTTSTGTELLLDLYRDPISREPIQPTEYAYLPENEQMRDATIEAYVERSIQMFTDKAAANHTNFPFATPESRRVHAPFFVTAAGLLPGPAFVFYPGNEAPVKSENPQRWERVQSWLRKLIDYQLWRVCATEDWFIKTATEQLDRTDNVFDDKFVDVCDFIGQVIAIAPTALPYVSDEVRTGLRPGVRLSRVPTSDGGYITHTPPSQGGVHAVERFTEEIENDGGDCEDGGMFAYRVARTLKTGVWEDPLVHAASRVVRQYIPTVNLGSVKDASVGNKIRDKKLEDGDIIDSESDKQQAFGAHMWCELVPVAKFIAFVKRSTPDLPASLLWPEGAVKALWIAALPQLVIEATGRISSIQLPRTSYVITNDKLKAFYVKRQNAEKAILSKILNSTKWFGMFQMVRRQSDVYETPNKRPTKFYRNATHLYTGEFVAMNQANIDFIHAQKGPRIPAPLNLPPNPLSIVLRPPGQLPPPPAPANKEIDVEHWCEKAAFHMAGDHEWENGEACEEVVKLLLSLGEKVEQGVDYAFECGVPMYDRLKNPLMQSVCLVPGSAMTHRELEFTTEVLRHNRPYTMPGDFVHIEKMHAAAQKSLLINNKIDTAQILALEDKGFAQLSAAVEETQKLLVSKGGTPRGVLLTFIFPFPLLGNAERTAKVISDIKLLPSLNFVNYLDLSMEVPVPFRRSVILRLFCSEPKPAQ